MVTTDLERMMNTDREIRRRLASAGYTRDTYGKRHYALHLKAARRWVRANGIEHLSPQLVRAFAGEVAKA